MPKKHAHAIPKKHAQRIRPGGVRRVSVYLGCYDIADELYAEVSIPNLGDEQ